MGVRRANKATQIDDLVQGHDIFILLETGHDAYSLAHFIERWCVLDGYTPLCSGVSTFGRAGGGRVGSRLLAAACQVAHDLSPRLPCLRALGASC
jgi:hypothetical protein